MSEENLERLKAAYEAFSRADFDAAAEIAHPEIDFIRAVDHPVRGAHAFRAWMEPDAFEVFIAEPLGFRVKGNKILVNQRNKARGSGSGIEVEAESWMVWTFDDDGRATRLEAFLEEGPALEAAGLRPMSGKNGQKRDV